jgi:hypothetical protein
MHQAIRMTIAVPLAVLVLASAGTAFGVGPDRVVQLGLVPADRTADEGTSRAAREADLPGLRPPRTARTGTAFEGLKREEAGSAVLYSGTRSFPALGAGGSQTVGGILYPLSSTWFSTLESSVDSGLSRPYRGYGLTGQVHRALSGGWDMSFGLQYNITEIGAPRLSAAIDSNTLTARQWSLYPPAGSSYTTTGYELRLNYRYGERNVLGLSYGSGSDLDYTRQMLGMQPGDGRQFGLTGEHWLNADWALNYGVMAHEQVGPHRGQGLRLGLRYRF